MKRNLLGAVKAHTSPLAESEFRGFVLIQHGPLSRENASADPSALDSVGTEALEAKQSGIPPTDPADDQIIADLNSPKRSKARRKASRAAKPVLAKKEIA